MLKKIELPSYREFKLTVLIFNLISGWPLPNDNPGKPALCSPGKPVV